MCDLTPCIQLHVHVFLHRLMCSKRIHVYFITINLILIISSFACVFYINQLRKKPNEQHRLKKKIKNQKNLLKEFLFIVLLNFSNIIFNELLN